MNRRCFHSHLGPWAIDPIYANNILSALQAGQINLVAQESRDIKTDVNMDVADSIAIVSVQGPMMKAPMKFDEGTSTVGLRTLLRILAKTEDVKGVILRIESPGGRTAGMTELASDVRALGGVKPVWAAIEDWAASAAFWLAASTQRIAINEAGRTGSIGTYAVLVDSSEQMKMEGLTIEVRKAGDKKGLGIAGTPITDDLRAEVDKMVDQANRFFLRAVAEGRNLSIDQVDKIADGSVFLADEALDEGLVDEVESFDETVANMLAFIEQRKRSDEMKERVNQL